MEYAELVHQRLDYQKSSKGGSLPSTFTRTNDRKTWLPEFYLLVKYGNDERLHPLTNEHRVLSRFHFRPPMCLTVDDVMPRGRRACIVHLPTDGAARSLDGAQK